jgi:cytochrome c oxidase subunit 2
LGGVRFPGLLAIPILLDHHHRVSQDGVQGIRVRFTGIHLPGVAGRVNPQAVAQTPPFNEPGVIQVAPGLYEVRMTAQIWSFAPREIRVPAGSRVHFTATSKDVVHGLFVPGVDLNAMLLPGQVAHVEARFDTPGEYPIICHEYCGIAHHTMAGTIIVEPRR